MNAISFTARKLADPFLLIAARKIETGNICPRIHFALPERHEIQAIGDLVEDRLIRVERIARLIHVPELDRRTDLEFPGVGLFLLRDQTKQSRFPGAVRTDNPDNAARRERE